MSKIRSFATKFILILIVLAMCLTGINQIFNESDYAAKVGKKKLSINHYQQFYNQEKYNLERMFNMPLGNEQLEALGFKRIVLDRMLQNELLNNFVSYLGIEVGDKSLIAAIKDIPDFQDEEGNFSKERFISMLADNNVNEKDYIAHIKQAIAKDIFLQSLKFLPGSYKTVAKRIYDYRYEQREAEIAILTPDMVKNIPKPVEGELKDFYQEHQQRFWSPELRSAKYAVINKEQLTSTVSAEQEEIEEQLNPLVDKIDVTYLAMKKKGEVQKIHDELGEKKLSDVPQNQKMEGLSRNMLPPALQEIFDLTEGEVSPLIKGPEGFYIFQVDKKYKISSEEKVKLAASIKQEIINDKINGQLEELINGLEEALSAGADIEDLATKYNFSVKEVGPIEVSDTHNPQVAKLMFRSDDQGLFDVASGQDGTDEYYYVRVTEVLPSRQQEFEESQNKVTAMWRADFVKKQLYKMAEQEEVLPTKTTTVFRTQVANTEAPKQDYPESLLFQLFNSQIGAKTEPVEYKNDQIIVATLKAIKPAQDNIILVDQIEAELKKSLIEANLNQLKDYLYKKFPVKVNDGVL